MAWRLVGAKLLPEPICGVLQKDRVHVHSLGTSGPQWHLIFKCPQTLSCLTLTTHYCVMTTTWLWRHMSIVPELGAIAKWGGHQKRVMAGKMTSMGLDLRHCGFGKPRAIPRQLIKAVGSAGGGPSGGKDLEQERSFPMGGVEAWFVRSEPLSRKVMNDWLDVMSVTPTRPMKHGVKKSGVRQRVGVKMTSSVHSIKAIFYFFIFITWTNAGILLIRNSGTNLPDGTKPLPEPMLTFHQLDSVALT